MINFIKADWPAPAHIYAGTTTRSGGSSEVPYHSFNLAEHVGDNPIKVMQNRQKLKEFLQLPSEPVWLTQTHSINVVEAIQQHRDAAADASYTTAENNVCVVMTADCLPILICDKQGTMIAAVHAGWRGLANGIIEATLDKFPCPSTDLLIWLGPAIGKKVYEVGKDVYDYFVNQDRETKHCFTPLKSDKWLANLIALAKIRLNKRNIYSIYESNHCTYTEEEKFFSARREKTTGRIASLIWMRKMTRN